MSSKNKYVNILMFLLPINLIFYSGAAAGESVPDHIRIDFENFRQRENCLQTQGACEPLTHRQILRLESGLFRYLQLVHDRAIEVNGQTNNLDDTVFTHFFEHTNYEEKVRPIPGFFASTALRLIWAGFKVNEMTGYASGAFKAFGLVKTGAVKALGAIEEGDLDDIIKNTIEVIEAAEDIKGLKGKVGRWVEKVSEPDPSNFLTIDFSTFTELVRTTEIVNILHTLQIRMKPDVPGPQKRLHMRISDFKNELLEKMFMNFSLIDEQVIALDHEEGGQFLSDSLISIAAFIIHDLSPNVIIELQERLSESDDTGESIFPALLESIVNVEDLALIEIEEQSSLKLTVALGGLGIIQNSKYADIIGPILDLIYETRIDRGKFLLNNYRY